MMKTNKEIFKQLSREFDDLAENIEDGLDFYNLRYELEEYHKVYRKYNLKGLYFYTDITNGTTFLCLTEAEHLFVLGLSLNQDIKMADAYMVRRFCENNYGIDIYAPSTGRTYHDIDSLKHDLLAAKLAGV